MMFPPPPVNQRPRRNGPSCKSPVLVIRGSERHGFSSGGDLPLGFSNRNDNKPCYSNSVSEMSTAMVRPPSVAYSTDSFDNMTLSSVASSCFEEDADECAKAFLRMINESRLQQTLPLYPRRPEVTRAPQPPTGTRNMRVRGPPNHRRRWRL